MEVSITDVSDVEKEIQIQTTASEITPNLEEAYKRYQAKIEIKGFRKGKAPLDLVKRIYGESIEYDSLNTIASDVYRKIVKERDIFPIGEPVLTDLDYKRGELLTFKVKYEIKPKIELKEYRNIPVEKLIHKVTEDEVTSELLRLRKSNSTLDPAESVTDDEHLVTADVQQLDESGSPLIGKTTPDARFYLANETLSPDIKDALKNVKAGDVRKVNIEQTHDDHQHKEFLELSVKKIEKVVLPNLDDEFVKKITKEKITSVSDFKIQLQKDIDKYWHDQSERKLLDSIIGEIVRRHEFSVPESLIKGVSDSLLEDVKNQYPNKKLPKDFDENKFRENNRTYAIFQAKWFLIQEQIINAEKISVEDADLELLAESEASKFGIEKDRLIQFYKSSDSMKDRVLHNKLTELLKKYAQITEKVVEGPIN
jgi:trigger factor